MRRIVLIGLAVLLVAAACTAGKPPSHPAPTSPAAKAASTNPVAALRRPLRLPALQPEGRCPVTRSHQVQPAFAAVLGDGPAYPTNSTDTWRDGRVEGGWYYAKVPWVASPAHPGPFLVRGRQLDGRRELRFGEGPSPTPSYCSPPVGPRTAQTATGSTGRPTPACAAAAATPTRSTAPAAPR